MRKNTIWTFIWILLFLLLVTGELFATITLIQLDMLPWGYLIGVIALLPLVLKITKNYVDRHINKKDIAPILSYDPQIQKEMERIPDENV